MNPQQQQQPPYAYAPPPQPQQPQQQQQQQQQQQPYYGQPQGQQPYYGGQQQQPQQQQPPMPPNNNMFPPPRQPQQPQPVTQSNAPATAPSNTSTTVSRQRLMRPPFVDPVTNIIYDVDNPEYEGWLTKQSMWLKVRTVCVVVLYCIYIAFHDMYLERNRIHVHCTTPTSFILTH
jgi:hypothetical protein